MIGKMNAPRKYEIARVGMFHHDFRPDFAYRKISGSLPHVDSPTIAPVTTRSEAGDDVCGTCERLVPDTDVKALMMA